MRSIVSVTPKSVRVAAAARMRPVPSRSGVVVEVGPPQACETADGAREAKERFLLQLWGERGDDARRVGVVDAALVSVVMERLGEARDPVGEAFGLGRVGEQAPQAVLGLGGRDRRPCQVLGAADVDRLRRIGHIEQIGELGELVGDIARVVGAGHGHRDTCVARRQHDLERLVVGGEPVRPEHDRVVVAPERDRVAQPASSGLLRPSQRRPQLGRAP